MTKRQSLLLESLKRCQRFLQKHPQVLQPIRLTPPARELDEVINTIDYYGTIQRAGQLLSQEETVRLHALRDDVRHIHREPRRSVKRGPAPDFVCQLLAAVDAVQNSAQDRDGHKRSSVDATAELPFATQRGRVVRKELHALVGPIVRDSRVLSATWDTAIAIEETGTWRGR